MRALLVCALLLLAPVAALPVASAMPGEPACNSDYPTYQACEDAKDWIACLRGDRPRCPT